jgi:mannose-6-phosphate isomerase-like protein (cupin superfamily)
VPQPHFFDSATIEWQPHATIPGIETKRFETRASYPAASVQLARVAVGGEIGLHTHPVETETAYVLAGEGVITADGQPHPFKVGIGATIPPGIAHSVSNTGDVPMEIFAIHIPPTI